MRAAKVRLHKRVILCDFAIRFRDTVERQRTYEVFKFMRRRLWTPHLLSGIEKQQLTPQSIGKKVTKGNTNQRVMQHKSKGIEDTVEGQGVSEDKQSAFCPFTVGVKSTY